MSEWKKHLTNLDAVTISIVNLLGEVGLYRYNKLTYIFEYLFIKNFGRRYTNEYFIRLPHGPVISNYKDQIEKVTNMGLFDCDLSALGRKRVVDDYKYERVAICRSESAGDVQYLDEMTQSLLINIIRKYGRLSIGELEQMVYKTKPMVRYMNAVDCHTKKPYGGHVLKDYLKISEHKTLAAKGRALALKHIQKYPEIDFEQQKQLAEELSDLEELRPIIND